MNINVSKGNQQLNSIDLEKEIIENKGANLSFFVGRSRDCHIILDDMQVSREHAEIKYIDGNWSIRGQNSFNPILINGIQKEDSILNNGDIITIGVFSLNIILKSLEQPTGSLTPNTFEEASSISEETAFVTNTIEDFDEETAVLNENNETELYNPDGTLMNANSEGQEEVTEEDSEVEDVEDVELHDDTFQIDDNSSENDIEETLSQSVESENDFSDSFGEEGEEESFDDDDESYALSELDGEEDDEKTRVIRAFSNITLDIFGEYAPYDKFIVGNGDNFIGRDPEKCQIALNDPEVSGVHAVIKKNNISCTLVDLKSGNGTLLNGERVNSHPLTNLDEFIIGSTTFTVKIESDFLDEEKDRLMPVEKNQMVEVEEIVEVDTNFEDSEGELILGDEGEGNFGAEVKIGSQSLFSKEALKDPVKRKKILYILVGLLAVWILLEDGDTKKKKIRPVKNKGKIAKPITKPNEVVLTKEQEEFVDATYILANDLFNKGRYSEALSEIDKIEQIIPKGYKTSNFIKQLSQEGLRELEKIEEEKRLERERIKKKAEVAKLLKQANDAFSKSDMDLAEGLMSKIAALDPENLDLSNLKLKISAFKRKKEREALEKAQKEAERRRQEDSLAPGKNYYMRKEWNNAILTLEKFLRQKGIDQDLVDQGTNMLTESKENLNAAIEPLLGKARSLKEGQDLKGAYENYLEVLNYDSSHLEALNEMNAIRERLEIRSKKIYREAIIAESLSLFDDAKEKFQEVQQVSPSDSSYYQKATEKLKEYLD